MPNERSRHLEQISDEVQRNAKEQFVSHFFAKYSDVHRDLPIWMATEVLSFGSVVRLLNDSQQDIRHNVSAFFGMPEEVFLSWLRTLNFARNVCAYHGQLWNRELAYRPKFPKMNKYPDWHRPVIINGGRVFAVLSICRHCLRKVAVGSAWGTTRSLLMFPFSAGMGTRPNATPARARKVRAPTTRRARNGPRRHRPRRR